MASWKDRKKVNSDKDYYAVLELTSIAATKDEVRIAYRRIVQTCHPDRFPGDAAAEEMFKEVNEAHEVLSDQDARQRYDLERRLGAGGPSPHFGHSHRPSSAGDPFSRGRNPFAPGGSMDYVDMGNLDPRMVEILSQLFGFDVTSRSGSKTGRGSGFTERRGPGFKATGGGMKSGFSNGSSFEDMVNGMAQSMGINPDDLDEDFLSRTKNKYEQNNGSMLDNYEKMFAQNKQPKSDDPKGFREAWTNLGMIISNINRTKKKYEQIGLNAIFAFGSDIGISYDQLNEELSKYDVEFRPDVELFFDNVNLNLFGLASLEQKMLAYHKQKSTHQKNIFTMDEWLAGEPQQHGPYQKGSSKDFSVEVELTVNSGSFAQELSIDLFMGDAFIDTHSKMAQQKYKLGRAVTIRQKGATGPVERFYDFYLGAPDTPQNKSLAIKLLDAELYGYISYQGEIRLDGASVNIQCSSDLRVCLSGGTFGELFGGQVNVTGSIDSREQGIIASDSAVPYDIPVEYFTPKNYDPDHGRTLTILGNKESNVSIRFNGD